MSSDTKSPSQTPDQDNTTNNGFWKLPLAKDQVTFIDHDCVIDKEGYPLYPNCDTTYVMLPGTKITNFGTVGFSKTTTYKKAMSGQWKIIRVHCLGVMICDYAGPPPTGTGKIDEFLSRYINLFIFVLI
jgi:hypothetical protein